MNDPRLERWHATARDGATGVPALDGATFGRKDTTEAQRAVRSTGFVGGRGGCESLVAELRQCDARGERHTACDAVAATRRDGDREADASQAKGVGGGGRCGTLRGRHVGDMVGSISSRTDALAADKQELTTLLLILASVSWPDFMTSSRGQKEQRHFCL